MAVCSKKIGSAAERTRRAQARVAAGPPATIASPTQRGTGEILQRATYQRPPAPTLGGTDAPAFRTRLSAGCARSSPGPKPQAACLARHRLVSRRNNSHSAYAGGLSPATDGGQARKKRRAACRAHASCACSAPTSCDIPHGSCYRPCTSRRRPCWHAGSLRSGRLQRFLGPAVRLLPRSPDTYRHQRIRSSDPG